jgi:diacylglycerol kinase family enzyme
VRAVALLGPVATDQDVRRFAMPGVNIFSGNELDAGDEPAAALVFGGDGTLHRHLSTLSVRNIPTLIVPMGSANDFAQSVGLPTVERSLAAWQRFCATADNVGQIDLGTIQPLPTSTIETHEASEPWAGESLETVHFVPDGPRDDLPRLGPRIMQSQLRRATDSEREVASETLFACIAGTGLDAAVNRRTIAQPRWVRAHGGYVFALVQVLGGFAPPRMTVSAEVDGRWQTVADEAGMLIAVGNGPQYGNGMRLTHDADMQDGHLDVCFVRHMSKLRLLRFFRIVFRGEHIGMEEVEYLKASRVRIVTDPPGEIFADGEPVCSTPVEIGVKRDALRVIT